MSADRLTADITPAVNALRDACRRIGEAAARAAAPFLRLGAELERRRRWQQRQQRLAQLERRARRRRHRMSLPAHRR